MLTFDDCRGIGHLQSLLRQVTSQVLYRLDLLSTISNSQQTRLSSTKLWISRSGMAKVGLSLRNAGKGWSMEIVLVLNSSPEVEKRRSVRADQVRIPHLAPRVQISDVINLFLLSFPKWVSGSIESSSFLLPITVLQIVICNQEWLTKTKERGREWLKLKTRLDFWASEVYTIKLLLKPKPRNGQLRGSLQYPI